jgi:hypothetical protein
MNPEISTNAPTHSVVPPPNMPVVAVVTDNTPFFSRSDQPRPEIIGGLIREGQLVTLAGDYGIGKSPLLADLVVHRVCGESWSGRSIEKGTVIHIDCESPGSTYRGAINRTAKRIGFPSPIVPGELEIFLEHDDSPVEGTTALRCALESPVTGALTLLERALARKPKSLVLIDPLELFFKLDSCKKQQVLTLYSKLRKLLAKFPHSAILLTFNLRKPDRKVARPDLLTNPREWLFEVCGSSDLLNRSDVRLGIDKCGDDGLVVNGVRRSEEMHPLLLRPALLNGDPNMLAGFCLIPAGELNLRNVFPVQLVSYWKQLPSDFTFEQATKLMGKANFSRLKQRAESFGILEKANRGLYHKLIA